MEQKNYGLYIHIPFCVKKCAYCDFVSFPMEREGRMQYLQFLAREMELWQRELSGYSADTIFVGGGTPSALSLEELDFLFGTLQNRFPLEQTKEFTVECNPGTVDREKLSLMREAGVNRISFGLQSALDKELKTLGRIHSYADFLESYELAVKTGFETINIDLMSAIPGQTLTSYEESLRQVIKLAPAHISSYSLIIEEGTPFYEKYGDTSPVDEETDRKMYEMTREQLASAGYERYEISNYAKSGKQCLHNMKYWRRQEYIGIGLSAASFWKGCRMKNEDGIPGYQEKLKSGKLPVCETETLTKQEEMAEFMFLGFRCMEGISILDFEKQFHEDFNSHYGETVKRFLAQGLMEQEGDRVFLTPKGIDVSNRIFEEFL